MNIWLQIKFRQYIIKTQDSRLKTQDLRLKTQDSRINNQESTVHRQGSQAWPQQPGQQATNQRWPIKQNTNGKWPKNRPLSQSFPDYIQSEHQSVLPGYSPAPPRTKDESQYN